jgi:hypothetical protein
MTTHPLLGPANCYEMLLMMALHPLRHVGQIEEIKAALENEAQNPEARGQNGEERPRGGDKFSNKSL